MRRVHPKILRVFQGFLREAEVNERCPGLCALGISWQTAQNKALRRSLGLRGAEGILITKAGGSVKGVLEPGDVVTDVAGAPVADDGLYTTRSREGSRGAPYHVKRRVGDEIDVGFVRAGALRVREGHPEAAGAARAGRRRVGREPVLCDTGRSRAAAPCRPRSGTPSTTRRPTRTRATSPRSTASLRMKSWSGPRR